MGPKDEEAEEAEEIARLKRMLLDMATRMAKGNYTGIDCILAYKAATGAYLKDCKDWYNGVKPKAEPISDSLEERVSALEGWVAAASLVRQQSVE